MERMKIKETEFNPHNVQTSPHCFFYKHTPLCVGVCFEAEDTPTMRISGNSLSALYMYMYFKSQTTWVLGNRRIKWSVDSGNQIILACMLIAKMLTLTVGSGDINDDQFA